LNDAQRINPEKTNIQFLGNDNCILKRFGQAGILNPFLVEFEILFRGRNCFVLSPAIGKSRIADVLGFWSAEKRWRLADIEESSWRREVLALGAPFMILGAAFKPASCNIDAPV
jgi:hypothetical protein